MAGYTGTFGGLSTHKIHQGLVQLAVGDPDLSTGPHRGGRPDPGVSAQRDPLPNRLLDACARQPRNFLTQKFVQPFTGVALAV